LPLDDAPSFSRAAFSSAVVIAAGLFARRALLPSWPLPDILSGGRLEASIFCPAKLVTVDVDKTAGWVFACSASAVQGERQVGSVDLLYRKAGDVKNEC
jgi:hypothetical protein